MKFYTLRGGYRNIPPSKLKKIEIKWDKKSKSKFQRGVKEFLYPYWKTHMVYEEFPVVGTRCTLDIVNLSSMIAIEVHGRQHEERVDFFQPKLFQFADQIRRDDDKRIWCEKNSLQLVEIYEDDLPLTKDFFLDNYDIEL